MSWDLEADEGVDLRMSLGGWLYRALFLYLWSLKHSMQEGPKEPGFGNGYLLTKTTRMIMISKSNRKEVGLAKRRFRTWMSLLRDKAACTGAGALQPALPDEDMWDPVPARQGGSGSIAGVSCSGINELKHSFHNIFKQEQFPAARRAAQGECLDLGHSGPYSSHLTLGSRHPP